MGGFAFIFGFLVVCGGAILMYATAGLESLGVYQAIGAALIQAGAIICGSGAIAAAIMRNAAALTKKQKSSGGEEK